MTTTTPKPKVISKASKIYAVIILALILLVTFGLYKIGYFKTVEVHQLRSTEKIVLGKFYKGSTSSTAKDSLFLQVGQLKKSGTVKGNVGGIYYNNPANNQGVMKGVVGIFVEDSTFAKPEGFKYYVVPPQQVIQAHLTASMTVVATKCYPALEDYRTLHNLSIDSVYVEWYQNDTSGYVEVAVKP